MTCTLAQHDGIAVLSFGAVLDNLVVEELRDTWREALGGGAREIRVEAEAVERISTPCIQVLIAGARAAQDNNITLKIPDPSDALAQSFADLGLSSELEALKEG